MFGPEKAQAEAEAEQRAKRPSRFGEIRLRLGRGPVCASLAKEGKAT